MFKAFTNKPFWVHLLLVMGIVAIIVLLFFGSLSFITSHGQTEEVPNVIGQNIEAAKKTLEAKGFDVQVQDSVFIDTIGRLAIVKQSPEASTKVKKGRTIYLTINRSIAPLIEMPNLEGFSFKSASLYLQTLHLKLGDTSYKPGFAKNLVIEQQYNGAKIAPGTKIPMGSTISFIISSGPSTIEYEVPDVYGMTLKQALDVLRPYNVTMGSIVTNGAITDTLGSYIFKQEPDIYSEPMPGQRVRNKIRGGQTMDFYIQSTAPAPRATSIADSASATNNPQ